MASREAEAEGHPQCPEETNCRAGNEAYEGAPHQAGSTPSSSSLILQGGDHRFRYQIPHQHDAGVCSFTSDGLSIICPIFLPSNSLLTHIPHKEIPLLFSHDSLPWHHCSYSGQGHRKEQLQDEMDKLKWNISGFPVSASSQSPLPPLLSFTYTYCWESKSYTKKEHHN